MGAQLEVAGVAVGAEVQRRLAHLAPDAHRVRGEDHLRRSHKNRVRVRGHHVQPSMTSTMKGRGLHPKKRCSAEREVTLMNPVTNHAHPSPCLLRVIGLTLQQVSHLGCKSLTV